MKKKFPDDTVIKERSIAKDKTSNYKVVSTDNMLEKISECKGSTSLNI